MLKLEDCWLKVIYLFSALGSNSSFFAFSIQALSKALTEEQLVYLRAQFRLLEPNRDGHISLDNFKMVIFCFNVNSCSYYVCNLCFVCVRGLSFQHNLLIST